MFRAWTEPEELKKWWRPAEGWSTPVVEVDLRAGGQFTLGAKPAVGELHVVRGEFHEVQPPERLVYTWNVEGADGGESLVTVEFRDKGKETEVTIIHRLLTGDSAGTSKSGWEGVLGSLQQLLA